MAEFDSLQLAITADADAAVSQLKRVAKALGALKGAAKAVHLGGIAGGFAGADGLKDALGKVREAASGFANVDIASIKNTASALRSLSSALGKSYDASSIESASKTIGGIDVDKLYKVNEAFRELGKTTGTFGAWSNVSGYEDIKNAVSAISEANLSRIAAGVRELGDASRELSDSQKTDLSGLEKIVGSAEKLHANLLIDAAHAITDFKNALASLDGEQFSEASGAIAQGILSIQQAVKGLNDRDIARLQALSGVMNSLGAVQNANLPSISLSGADENPPRAAQALPFAQGDGSGFGKFSTAAMSALQGLGNLLAKVYRGFSLAALGAGSFTSVLARLIRFRFIRSILSSFTQGAAEGLKNLAHYSASANATLSQLSTGTLYLKNSLGAALYPAIASVIGIFQSLVSVVVRALNAISMFFSALGGKSTYMRAKEYAQDYGGALDGAAGSAAALKQELMGFDEINALSPSGGGGGGGGGGAGGYGDMFEEVPIDIPFADMIESGDFSPLGMALAAKINEALDGIDWDDIRSKAAKFATGISTFINGFFEEIDPKTIGKTLAGVINTGATFVGTFWSKTDWKLIGTRIAQSINESLADIDAVTLALAIYGKFNAMVDSLGAFAQHLNWGDLGTTIGTTIGNVINGIDLKGAATALMDILEGAITTAKFALEAADINVLAGKIVSALKIVVERVPSLLGSLIDLGLKFVSAVGKGIEDALSDITAQQVIDGIKTAVADFISRIDFDAVIEIGNLSFAGLAGASIATAGLLGVIAKFLPGLSGNIGLSGIAGILFTLSAGIDIVANAAEILSGEISGIDLSDKLFEMMGKVLFGALFGIVAVAAGATGGAVWFSVAVGVKIGQIFFGESAGGDLYDQSLIDAATNLDELALAVQNLTGLNVDTSFIASLVPKDQVDMIALASGDIEVFRQAVIALMFAYFSGGSASQEWLKQVGLISDESENMTTSVNQASESVNSVSEKLQTAADNADTLSTSMGGVDSGGLNLDDQSLKDFSGSLSSTSTALGDVGSELVLTSSDATTLKDSIVAIPTMKSIYFNILNFDPVLKKVNQLASAIRNIGSKSISIRVKAGLESGSKAFLNALGSLASGTLKASINSLVATSAFAQGGFPTAGDIFIANENGRQELVGRIGNRPAVANQDQIGDAIFRYMSAYGGSNSLDPDRLAAAIVSGMKEAGIGATYLDGRMIAQSINRETQRSGKPAIVF